MQLLDLSFDSPPENLACDEAILEECEANGGAGVLRFWESPRYFVVVGYTGKLSEEANLAACHKMQIPVLRRCSGGGTVVQGKGCLNYSLVAPIAEGESLTGLSKTNCAVMQANARALTRALGAGSTPATRRGITDLTIGDLKFSGNAQRRKRRFFLFHGTFLLDFDLSLIPQILLEPKVQPDYRALRSHEKFITNLNIPAQAVKDALVEEWNASGVLPAPRERMEKLIAEKYARAEWNEKFL
jgi:lipoate-protein ligase A